MEVDTYSKSRVFMSQYHALRILKDLNKEEGKLPRRERVEQEGRKIDWLVTRYRQLAEKKHKELAKTSATTFLARRIHAAEIKNLYGRHCLWLKEQIKKQKLLNVNDWDRFCNESIRLQNRAHARGSPRVSRSPSTRAKSEEFEDVNVNVDQLQEDDPMDAEPEPEEDSPDVSVAGSEDGYGHTVSLDIWQYLFVMNS